MGGKAFCWWSGLALCAAAVLTVFVNAALTPLLPHGSFDALATSQVFLIRQSLASAAALLMLFGIIGLHVARLHRVRLFDGVAFTIAIAGAAGLFATEWNQLFTIRDFALHAPQALNAVENAGSFTPFDIGALASAATFFLGWFVFAISLLLSKFYSRQGPLVALAASRASRGDAQLHASRLEHADEL